jgi:hypothetical protein
MLRSILFAALASVALLVTVNTSDAAWRGGFYRGGYYGARPYYNYYRPFVVPAYPSYYYGPTYYPGTSYYYGMPGIGVYIH